MSIALSLCSAADDYRSDWFNVTADDVSAMFGCGPTDLPASVSDRLATADLRYRPATLAERDALMLRMVRYFDEAPGPRTAVENHLAFEQGWSDNLQRCLSRGISDSTLRPAYMRPLDIARFRGGLVSPADPQFVDHLLGIAATCTFEAYMRDATTVYEFGCGTGRYLRLLSQLFPDKELVGSDWAEASVKILDLMRASGVRVRGMLFDMLQPPSHITLVPGSGVFTFGALEQLGGRFDRFLAFLLENRPSIVLHHEPIVEFYDENELLDYLSIRYHRQRGYLDGYWTALREMEARGDIVILDSRRTFYGEPRHESTSFIAWRPV